MLALSVRVCQESFLGNDVLQHTATMVWIQVSACSLDFTFFRAFFHSLIKTQTQVPATVVINQAILQWTDTHLPS